MSTAESAVVFKATWHFSSCVLNLILKITLKQTSKFLNIRSFCFLPAVFLQFHQQTLLQLEVTTSHLEATGCMHVYKHKGVSHPRQRCQGCSVLFFPGPSSHRVLGATSGEYSYAKLARDGDGESTAMCPRLKSPGRVCVAAALSQERNQLQSELSIWGKCKPRGHCTKYWTLVQESVLDSPCSKELHS